MAELNGKFFWYELGTTDVEAAKAFYRELIGWEVKEWPDGGYSLWSAGGTEVGGAMALPEEARKAGAPPHWMGYVLVDDTDASARRAMSLGGKIVVDPQDIPKVGRFAILADPQGAMFAVMTPIPMEGGGGTVLSGPGGFSWNELNSTDWQAGWKFYSELFGWKRVDSLDMGPELGEYFMFGTATDQAMGGMSNAARMMKAPAHWLHYIRVKSVDETVKRIPEKGGKVLNGPMDVPGGDRIAQCMDPQGALFAIHSSAAK